MRALAAILLIGGAYPTAARAQDQADVTQISASPAGESAEQLSATGDSKPDESQLTSARMSQQQPSQVAKAGRSAQPPLPISTPEQGRTAAVDRVHGSDRCDPANRARKVPAECSKVIETRAGEYQRPSPRPLSPEQRLMVDQQLRATDATGQLATTGEPDTIDAMGIASLVLNQTKQDAAKKDEQDPSADAAAEAVVNFLGVVPPPPQ